MIDRFAGSIWDLLGLRDQFSWEKRGEDIDPGFGIPSDINWRDIDPGFSPPSKPWRPGDVRPV